MVKNRTRLSVHLKITEYLFNTKKFDANFIIAKILLEKASQLPDITIEEVAYLSNTSPASITKFCKRLGYSGFIDLKKDRSFYTGDHIFYAVNDVAIHKGVEESLQYFITQTGNLYQRLFHSFDEKQLRRIATKVAISKKITIFSGLHSFVATTLFIDFLLSFGIFAYEIERTSDPSLLKSLIKGSDYIFIISFSGEWITKHFKQLQLDKEELGKIALITYTDSLTYDMDEIISFSNIEDFFTTIYISGSTIQLFFVLLSIYIGIEKDNLEKNIT